MGRITSFTLFSSLVLFMLSWNRFLTPDLPHLSDRPHTHTQAGEDRKNKRRPRWQTDSPHGYVLHFREQLLVFLSSDFSADVCVQVDADSQPSGGFASDSLYLSLHWTNSSFSQCNLYLFPFFCEVQKHFFIITDTLEPLKHTFHITVGIAVLNARPLKDHIDSFMHFST